MLSLLLIVIVNDPIDELLEDTLGIILAVIGRFTGRLNAPGEVLMACGSGLEPPTPGPEAEIAWLLTMRLFELPLVLFDEKGLGLFCNGGDWIWNGRTSLALLMMWWVRARGLGEVWWGLGAVALLGVVMVEGVVGVVELVLVADSDVLLYVVERP